MAGKIRASSHSPIEPEAKRFRQIVGMDYLEFTVNGKKFHGHGFIDYYSTSAEMYIHRTRDARHSAQGLLQYLNSTEEFVDAGESTCVKLVHDMAKEFLAKSFKKVAVYSQTVTFTSSPYMHQHNPHVERFNQTIQRMVTVAMHDSNAPEIVIPHCIEHCLMVYDVVPVKRLGWKSRYEMRTGRKPDVRYLYQFGILCRVLKPLEKRQHKFDTYSEDCVFLCNVRDGRGVKFLRLSNKTVYTRNDMVVVQGKMPFRSVGGLKESPTLQINSANAANLDLLYNARWDEEDEDDQTPTPNNTQATDVPSPAGTVVGARIRNTETSTPMQSPAARSAPISPSTVSNLSPVEGIAYSARITNYEINHS